MTNLDVLLNTSEIAAARDALDLDHQRVLEARTSRAVSAGLLLRALMAEIGQNYPAVKAIGLGVVWTDEGPTVDRFAPYFAQNDLTVVLTRDGCNGAAYVEQCENAAADACVAVSTLLHPAEVASFAGLEFNGWVVLALDTLTVESEEYYGNTEELESCVSGRSSLIPWPAHFSQEIASRADEY